MEEFARIQSVNMTTSEVIPQENFALLLLANPEETTSDGLLTLQIQLNSSVNNAKDFSKINDLFVQESINMTKLPAVSVALPQEVLDFYSSASNTSSGLYSVIYRVSSSLFHDFNAPSTGSLILTIGQAGVPGPTNLNTPVQFTFEPTQVNVQISTIISSET